MSSALVDTSVWVAHFKRYQHVLAKLLDAGLVMVHPLVMAEIACGSPPDRQRTLANLSLLSAVRQARLDEVLSMVDRDRLYGLGCGFVDLTLLHATRITPGATLWTLDKPLNFLAERFGVKRTAGSAKH